MKIIILLSAIFLFLLHGMINGQVNLCEESEPICTGPVFTYPAGTTGSAEPGAYYGCLQTQPAPAWYHMLIEDPGDITIYMYSSPLVDIDFICWGPFANPHSPCVAGLTSGNVVDCSYSPNPNEYCDIPDGQAGEYYILMITNYSQQPTEITFSQTAGTGSLDCAILNTMDVNFTATPTSGPPPLIVNFLDQSTGEPTSWKWDFQNDGTYDAFEQNPYFIYPEAGIYSVKLWAENQYEIDSIVYVDYITITEPDLLVQNPIAYPEPVFAGDTLFIAYDVMNQGNGDAGVSNLRYYLSPDDVFDSIDIELGFKETGIIEAGMTESQTDVVTIPPATNPGSWYILFFADADQQLEESDEGNNVNLAIFIVDTATWIISHDSSDETPGIRVYPNPGRDQVFIDYSELKIETADVEIFNEAGLRVTTMEITAHGRGIISTDCSKWPAGSYFIRITSGGKIFQKVMLISG
jgi:PKD repeat protein